MWAVRDAAYRLFVRNFVVEIVSTHRVAQNYKWWIGSLHRNAIISLMPCDSDEMTLK